MLTLWNDQSGFSRWQTLSDFQNNVDRLFERFPSVYKETELKEEVAFHPHCEISETETHYLLSFDLPGVPKKEIQIELDQDRLIVSGERKSEKEFKGFSERVYGKFQRAVALPADVRTEQVEAQYQDGVLTVAVPKAESVKPKQIKISEGKSSFFSRLVGAKEESKAEIEASSPKVV